MRQYTTWIDTMPLLFWLFSPLLAFILGEQKPAPPLVHQAPAALPRVMTIGEGCTLSPADFRQTGERDAILASSGQGKSWLTGVIAEETLETGGLVCVMDPEGEHYTLAERYPVLVVGGDHATIPLPVDGNVEADVMKIVATMLAKGVSAVFDLSDFADSGQREHFARIGNALFEALSEAPRKIRLIAEEAQIFAPQTGAGQDGVGSALAVSRNIAKRGRKRALDSLWATQRPASINKDILSQCNRFWFGGIQAEQDYKAIKSFLDQAGISFESVRALKPGEFYLYAKGQTQRLKVRKRHCKHGGVTPVALEGPRAGKKEVSEIVKGFS